MVPKMAPIVAMGLLVAVALVAQIFRRGGPPTSRPFRPAGMLVYAVSSLPLACLQKGSLSCGRCGLRHQCHRSRWVPMGNRAASRPRGTVGKREVSASPGEGLERIGRFIAELIRLVGLLNRLVARLSTLLIQFQGVSQIVRGIWRTVRLLSMPTIGLARL